MLDWFWAYLTYRSGTRLITGSTAVTASTMPVTTTIQTTDLRPANAA
jgi:hypothetical protein